MSINWREFKRELLEAPSKVSKTFQSSDIFNQNSESKSPKPRLNNTNQSHIFDKSDTKFEYPITPNKKRDTQRSDLFTTMISTPQKTQNQHKRPDHEPQYFHNVEPANDRRPLTSRPNEEFQPKILFKSPKILKQEELHSGRYNSRQQEKTVPDSDRIITQDMSSRDKRRVHMESNIFGQSRSQTPSRQQKEQRELSVDHFKRQNQNLSTMFGQTLGALGSVAKEKAHKRELSSDMNWMCVDTIRNQKDIGQKVIDGNQRSRLGDQRSVMDSHNYNPQPSQRLSTLANDPVLRMKKRNQQLQDLHTKFKKASKK